MARLRVANGGYKGRTIVHYIEWTQTQYDERALKLAKQIVADRDVSWRSELTDREQKEFVKRAKFYMDMVLS